MYHVYSLCHSCPAIGRIHSLSPLHLLPQLLSARAHISSHTGIPPGLGTGTPPKVSILTKPKSVQVPEFLKDLSFGAEAETTAPSIPYLRNKRREMYMGLYMRFCSQRATLEGFFLCPLTYFKTKSQISI